MTTATGNKFSTTQPTPDFAMDEFHKEMQRRRKQHQVDLTFKQMLAETWGEDYSPERFYKDVGIDIRKMTVQKLLNTSELSRWLFPEVFRDAIRQGMEYTPFFRNLTTGEESIDSTGLTMPKLTLPPAQETRLRDTKEGADITIGTVTWGEKQVTIKKKARGMEQTYESIMFTPIDLSRVYFEEVGARLGADLDRDLIDIAVNGDQADGSEAAPVIGAATANTLLYTDIARAWIRFKRLNRSSAAMLMTEADAITVLNMSQFENKNPANGTSTSGVTLNVNTPLPTSQDIYVHSAVPTSKIIFVDPRRAFVQLTAMPLLIESDRIVQRQFEGEYVSIITGFANVFKDGRLVLDYSTNLTTNPGPTPVD